MENTVTFVKVQTGIFNAFLNGQPTEYQIVNGCLGMSGRDTVNTYGVYNKAKDTVRWFGPLRTCKAAIAFTLTKDARSKWVDSKEIPTPKVSL